MAYTRKWDDIIALAKPFVKKMPTSTYDAQICDYISSDMWTAFPFKESLTTIPAATIPLVDGTQDYSVPPSIYRLTRAHIRRTDTTPNMTYELDVAQSLPVDLVKRSYMALRAIAHQPAVGMLRLESAVNVMTGMTLEIHGEYQINVVKVTATTQSCWFADHYAPVAHEGLLYHYYKLSDDPRAGTVQMGEGDKPVYTGQLAAWRAALMRMQRAEDYGGIDSLFPAEPMGADRNTSSGLTIFP